MDYRLERRLSELDSDLHRRYKDCVVTSQFMLTNYQGCFPEYTDHTLLHTMNVIDFCNRLIGEQINRLKAEDIYVLLMGCLFHDVGMGISQEDYELFLPELNNPSPAPELSENIRNFHQELSAMYLEKYWMLLDIPNEAYLCAIMQICRGHRKTELLDTKNYPIACPVGERRSVCTPYLAAILRLADELDIAADRNMNLIYDIKKINTPTSRMEFAKHQAIRSVELGEHTVTLCVQSDDPVVRGEIMLLCEKLEDKLRYCRLVAESRSEFVITQQNVRLDISDAKKPL